MKFKLFFLVLVLCLNFVLAGFQVGTPSHVIDLNYSHGDFIKGWINISLSDESKDAIITTSEGDSVKLISVLNASQLLSDCNVGDCDVQYNLSNTKSNVFSLNKGQTKIVGFKFNENMIEQSGHVLNSIKFKISSDVGESCYPQLKVDLFNDGEIDIYNTNLSNDKCNLFRTNGCFNSSKIAGKVFLDPTTPICQKVELPESNGFRLGANISSTELSEISFSLNDASTGNLLDSCFNSSVLGEGEFFCDIDYQSSETGEYYVCVTNPGDAPVEISYYPDDDGCGFFGLPPNTEDASYNIFAYPKKFGSFNTFSIPGNYDYDIIFDVENYLLNKYGGYDCGSLNCVVPVKFISGDNQQITLENVQVSYNTKFGSKTNTYDFYNVSSSPSKINLGFKKILLDPSNFNTPLEYGSKDFTLSLDGSNIFTQEIYIKEVPIIYSFKPSVAIASIPTTFDVLASSPNTNISKYRWNFENNILETTSNKINYTFSKTGEFVINVTIFDGAGLNVSKSFNVTIETPINAVNLLFKEKLSLLNTSKSQLNSFSDFYQTSLQPIFNLVQKENTLTRIKDDLDNANPDVSSVFYIDLLNELSALNFPLSIFKSKSSEEPLPFYFDKSKINLDALSKLGDNYSLENEDNYKDAILVWMNKNVDAKINFDEISANFGQGPQVLLNGFKLEVDSKNKSNKFYVVFSNPESFNFKENYGKIEKNGYIYIPIENSKTIVFSTTDKFSFSDLPVFISPAIQNLNVLEIDESEENDYTKWIFFGLIIFVVLILGLVIYFILQKWYKNKYESYLFSNKNDLYNLVSFIQSAKKSGKTNDEITDSLKKSGWSGEQLRYIIRKYLGKRTGMFELPIDKIFRKKTALPASARVAPLQKFPARRPPARRRFN